MTIEVVDEEGEAMMTGVLAMMEAAVEGQIEGVIEEAMMGDTMREEE